MENYYVILQKQLSSIEFMNEHRPEHLRYLKDVDEKGELIIAGRYKNGTGGLIIVCTEDYDRALEIAKNDPYIINEVRDFTILDYGKFDPQSIP
ncbi:MAG: hypothetical protein HS049_03260 [Thaumarchaeota archaeon]|uniref:YCII-related domain-containing protein n=1 Tax=uncultured marine thaumarchaeote AD1000_06_A03 TaxID=1455884 RepID=A0A075FML9_9ARCH|nr:hypothetical protein [uncultured marine thaumarchaeote AD1000_06_A03]NSL76604.1 hypothetical protein [Nitrososphaerota archaeon]|tara:strand:- start:278 stop:559 length:282 start_codon:yes stop_codon:yes gene_type:complete